MQVMDLSTISSYPLSSSEKVWHKLEMETLFLQSKSYKVKAANFYFEVRAPWFSFVLHFSKLYY